MQAHSDDQTNNDLKTESPYTTFFNNLTISDDEPQENLSSYEPEEVEEEEEESPEPSSQQPKRKRLSQSERQKKIIQELKEQLTEKENLLLTEAQKSAAYEVELFHKRYNELEGNESYWDQISQGCKTGLQISLEDGETDAAADYTAKMQDAKIKLETIRNEKARVHSLYNQYNQHRAQSAPQYTPTSSLNPELDDFLERNPYLSPNSKQNYSPEANAMVNKLSSELTREYKMNGRGEEVQSERYFRELENRMKNTFNQQEGGASNRPTRSARMVAPVGKRESIASTPNPDRFSNSDKVKMVALRNLFGDKYDDILHDTFANARKNRPY